MKQQFILRNIFRCRLRSKRSWEHGINGFEIYIIEIHVLKEGVKRFIELLKTEYETWNRNKQFKKAGERLFKDQWHFGCI